MKIAIGSDHGGYLLKEDVKKYLEEKQIETIDLGCNSLESVDYPLYAQKVGKLVSNGEVSVGILVCTTGVGMCIASNKVKGVRAVLVNNEDMCRLSREHNNCNVLCLGSKYTTKAMAEKYIGIFLSTPFAGGRHERRVNMIEQ